jgi:hypothetical protein
MAVSFKVARVNETVPAGASQGWAVFQIESGKPDAMVSRLYMTSAEAEAEAEKFRAKEAARDV